MVQFRIAELQVVSFDDGMFRTVLEGATAAGGEARFPTLFSVSTSPDIVDPLSVVDDLGRLAATEHGQHVAMLIGTLRDDLMEAVAAADEG